MTCACNNAANISGTYDTGTSSNIDVSNFQTSLVTVMTTGDCEVFATCSGAVGDESLWTPCTLTDNSCVVQGPITGIRIVGSSDGSYAIRVS